MLRGTLVLTFYFVCVIVLRTTHSQTSNDCVTPTNQTGLCIDVKKCEPILNVLRRRPTNRRLINSINKYRCGFEPTGAPKVCCPGTPIAARNADDGTKWTAPPDPDNLLDKDNCGTFVEYRIFSENITMIDEYPWTVLLQYANGNRSGFHCTGVLINKRYVLTAAHCVNGPQVPANMKLTSVRLGEHDINRDVDCEDYALVTDCAAIPVNVDIENVIVHSNYSAADLNHRNDLALLRLRQNVNYSDYILPICLPTSSDEFQNLTVGYRVSTTGWGHGEGLFGKKWMFTQKMNSTLIDSCTSHFRSNNISIDVGQICTIDSEQKIPCNGNSGGSLVTPNHDHSKYILNGVQSFGTTCTNPNKSTVYTRINYRNIKWMLDNIRP